MVAFSLPSKHTQTKMSVVGSKAVPRNEVAL